MSILDLHSNVVQDYQRYAQSFLSISDDRLREFVEKQLMDDAIFCPNVLVQLNPAYKLADTVAAAARAAYRSAVAAFKGFRFHDLRHQAITELAEHGASDATLMAIAGHMSRQMLEHYCHFRMEARRAALNALEGGLMGAPPREDESEPKFRM